MAGSPLRFFGPFSRMWRLRGLVLRLRQRMRALGGQLGVLSHRSTKDAHLTKRDLHLGSVHGILPSSGKLPLLDVVEAVLMTKGQRLVC